MRDIPIPAVNMTPMNQRAARFSEIQRFEGPFPATRSNEFGYWFNYLWKEAREAFDLTPGDKGRLCDAFFSVLHLDPSGTTPTPLPSLASMPAEKKRQILTTLLTIGFKRVPRGGVVPAAGGFVSVDRAVDARSLFLQQLQAHAADRTMKTVALGFRADGRSYEQIAAQGGFNPRARSHGQAVMEDYGLTQPWNPFSQPIYGDSLFLRKGNSMDNCLHTVVSVAMSLPEVASYPLLSDPTLFPHGCTALSKWTPQMEQEARAHRYNVRTVRLTPKGPIDHVESDLSIYVVNVAGRKAYSTKKFQEDHGGGRNAFPESAVEHIPVEDILAQLTFTRSHWSDSQGKLELFDVDFGPNAVTMLPNEKDLARRFGAPFVTQLRAKLMSLQGACKHNCADANAMYQKAKRASATAPPTAKVTCDRCGDLVAPKLLAMHQRICRAR